MEHTDIMSATIKHFHRKHKMLPLIRVRNVKCLCRAILFTIVQVELLHVLVGITDSDKRAQLGGLLALSFSKHLFLTHSPSISKQIDTWRRTEESFFVTVRFLRNLRMKDYNNHVASIAQIPFHCLACQPLILMIRSINTGSESRVNWHNRSRRRRRLHSMCHRGQTKLVWHI